MVKSEGSAVMNKAAFCALLKENGYTLDTQSAGVPSVICDTADISKVSKKIRELATEAGYPGSFGVRGNSVMPEPETAADETPDFSEDPGPQEENNPSQDNPDDDYEQMSLFNM